MQFLVVFLLLVSDIIKLVFCESPVCPLGRIPVVGRHDEYCVMFVLVSECLCFKEMFSDYVSSVVTMSSM